MNEARPRIIRAKADPNWGQLGHDSHLIKHLELPDPNFVSDWDFDTNYSDRLIRTPKVNSGGTYIRVSRSVSGSIVLDNGETAVFTFTTRTPTNGTLRNMSIPDISLFANAEEGQYLLPGGSSIDDSQWQYAGPWNDWRMADGFKTVSRIFIRNISAGTTTVIARAQGRAIAGGNKT